MEFDSQTWEMLGKCIGAGCALGFGGIGAAVGMGIAAGHANEGIMRQPETQGTMLRTMLIGQAVGGSPSIFALVIGLLILFVKAGPEAGPGYTAAMIGAGLSIGLGCLGSGYGCGFPAGKACEGLARNPRHGGQITTLMIVGQAVAQTPSIFATVIALIMIFLFDSSFTAWHAFGIYLGAGLSMGAGALGPGIGSGNAAAGAVHGSSHWPESNPIMMRTMLVAQAVSQTPAIFGMLVAFLMLFMLRDLPLGVVGFAMTLGAGISAGFGGIGPGIGSGLVGETTCQATAAKPRLSTLMLQTMLIGQAVSQSTAIYALIIAFLLLYAF